MVPMHIAQSYCALHTVRTVQASYGFISEVGNSGKKGYSGNGIVPQLSTFYRQFYRHRHLSVRLRQRHRHLLA